MDFTAPKITVQNTADGRIRVSVEAVSPEQESLSFTVLIEPAPTHPTGRPVHELGLAACQDARHLLHELEQTFFSARALLAAPRG